MLKDIEIFKGAWRRRRALSGIVLLIFFLVAPWIQVNGHPFLRIDVVHQKVFLMGVGVFFNELILVVPVLIGILFLILAVTSLWGRVWCGWACPHPVFLEFLYRPYEKWIKKYDFGIPVLKWIGFVFFSIIVGNIFISFVAGPVTVLEMMLQSPSLHSGYFTAMLIISGGFLFNFGVFRERMCTTTCPYGRLQSVLLDPNSLVVMYNQKRGEPRGKKGTVTGDCIDCKRCIVVCPTRIDIRNGTQLECIHCTACMDACDDVMKKLGREEKLIGYSSQNLSLGIISHSKTRQILYITATAILFAFAGVMYRYRQVIDVVVFRFTLADEYTQDQSIITKHVRLSIRNKQDHDLPVLFESGNGVTVMSPQTGQILKTGEKMIFELFLKIPTAHFGTGIANETVTVKMGEEQRVVPIQLVGRK